MDNFAVFILSHGRPDHIKTLKALQKGHYTGKTYIVIDNEDDTAGEYRKRYGNQVIEFDKLAVSKTFDTADNFDDRRAVVYARNACFDIAERLGIEYFLELDDDYSAFQFRMIEGDSLRSIPCTQLDRAFEAMIRFLDASGALSVAFSQGGDLLGGADNANYHKRLLRKAMNTFFCKTSNKFQFLGRVNEDVNTYTCLGNRGHLFFTYMPFSINQTETQKSKGGMSEMYLDSGTYVKSFYTVMFCPSSVKIGTMGSAHKRIHHLIDWNHCVPCIISPRYKK